LEPPDAARHRKFYAPKEFLQGFSARVAEGLIRLWHGVFSACVGANDRAECRFNLRKAELNRDK
jgi:hypothetical protein